LPYAFAIYAILAIRNSYAISELGKSVVVSALLRAATNRRTARLDQDRPEVRLSTEDLGKEESYVGRLGRGNLDLDIAGRHDA
jgi:hypothetical protein